MSTRMKDLIPVLMCDDTQESIRFYCEVLGFQVSGRMDDVGKSGWASLNNGHVELMLASPHGVPEAVRADGRFPQLNLYFYPEDVAALHQHVASLGYEPSALTVRFYGMKEFELLDPSGHVLVFGQETDEPAPDKPAPRS